MYQLEKSSFNVSCEDVIRMVLHLELSRFRCEFSVFKVWERERERKLREHKIKHKGRGLKKATRVCVNVESKSTTE